MSTYYSFLPEDLKIETCKLIHRQTYKVVLDDLRNHTYKLSWTIDEYCDLRNPKIMYHMAYGENDYREWCDDGSWVVTYDGKEGCSQNRRKGQPWWLIAHSIKRAHEIKAVKFAKKPTFAEVIKRRLK
jgi:hypothetical protein